MSDNWKLTKHWCRRSSRIRCSCSQGPSTVWNLLWACIRRLVLLERCILTAAEWTCACRLNHTAPQSQNTQKEDGDCSCEIKRRLLLGRKAVTNLDSVLKCRDITLPMKVYMVNLTTGFPRCHAQMWELDHKEGWACKNWCFWIVVLEKTFKSPLDSKEIKPVNPKGNKPWVFIGRTDAEAETPILWPPDAKSWPLENILRLGKIEGKRRMGQQRIKGLASTTQWTWIWVNSRR